MKFDDREKRRDTYTNRVGSGSGALRSTWIACDPNTVKLWGQRQKNRKICLGVHHVNYKVNFPIHYGCTKG